MDKRLMCFKKKGCWGLVVNVYISWELLAKFSWSHFTFWFLSCHWLCFSGSKKTHLLVLLYAVRSRRCLFEKDWGKLENCSVVRQIEIVYSFSKIIDTEYSGLKRTRMGCCQHSTQNTCVWYGGALMPMKLTTGRHFTKAHCKILQNNIQQTDS